MSLPSQPLTSMDYVLSYAYFIGCGLIPTTVEETWGTLFSLTLNTLPEGEGLAPSAPVLLHQPNHQVMGEGPVVVNFVYGGDTVLGCASIIYISTTYHLTEPGKI
jgi:hypothetical protein